ncbi:ubiquinol-cytochrome c reductase cytochrome b subunit [Leifsonia sp. Leaf264]|nr:ubiquinol-cytochrome c reductase cytochrome b subunit [Leifsonia sp. Leaf264]
MFGVVSMACVAVIFVTGVFLTLLYEPSSAPVIYNGRYAPLDGVTMSEAMRSTMNISFEVQGGMLIRQAHHWAALLLPASLILQLLVTYFTGGFRRPRRLGWVLLFLTLIVALVGGWSGYALPDDVLAGTGLRIVEGIVLGIPVVGTSLASILFGGEFPGSIIENLYPIHVALVPGALILLLAARIRVGWSRKPAQFAGPGRTERNVVGLTLWPAAATRAFGLFAIVSGLLVLISATVTIGPSWLYGPSSPGDASAGSQPDWYTGFLDGALRLVPPGWEVEWLGHTWTLAILIPLVVVSLFLLAVVAYPFIEEWTTGDSRDHNLLDRPRNTPGRTGFGVAGIVFFGALWGAGSADIAATHFRLGIESVVHTFQVLLLVGPIIAFVLTRRICLALQNKDRELLLHGFETGRIVRLPGGEYTEIHQAVDTYERWSLQSANDQNPYQARPDERGRLRPVNVLRARISRFFFADTLAPIPPGELGQPTTGVVPAGSAHVEDAQRVEVEDAQRVEVA